MDLFRFLKYLPLRSLRVLRALRCEIHCGGLICLQTLLPPCYGKILETLNTYQHIFFTEPLFIRRATRYYAHAVKRDGVSTSCEALCVFHDIFYCRLPRIHAARLRHMAHHTPYHHCLAAPVTPLRIFPVRKSKYGARNRSAPDQSTDYQFP